MTKPTVGRIIGAVLALILFVSYTHMHNAYTPHSRDLGDTVRQESSAPSDPVSEPAEAPVPEPTPEPTPLPTPEPEPTPAPVPTTDPNSPYGKALSNAAALGLPEPPDVDVNSWELILVNATHPIAADYEPEIATVSESLCPQDARIADALGAFAEDCRAQGLPVLLGSGYRSYYIQSQTYEAKAQEYGYEVAAKIVAPPGTSEHQTGLCCDITDYLRQPMVPEVLSQTDTFRWLNAHCQDYGFILRYPEGKENITGIIYEPWHFRYVGTDAARYIQENQLTLEEFLALYGVE